MNDYSQNYNQIDQILLKRITCINTIDPFVEFAFSELKGISNIIPCLNSFKGYSKSLNKTK